MQAPVQSTGSAAATVTGGVSPTASAGRGSGAAGSAGDWAGAASVRGTLASPLGSCGEKLSELRRWPVSSPSRLAARARAR